jgi:peptidoglycan hydrolase CwlO-like protein
MKSLIGVLFLVFVALFVYFAYFNPSASVEQLREKAESKAKTLASEKDALLKSAEAELKQFEKQIEDLKSRVGQTQEQALEVKKKIDELNQQREALQSKLGDFKKAGEKRWKISKPN